MLVASDTSFLLAVAIAFVLVAHPKTFNFVHKLVKKVSPSGPNIVNAYGVSTTTGLIAHALVAALLAMLVLRFL